MMTLYTTNPLHIELLGEAPNNGLVMVRLRDYPLGVCESCDADEGIHAPLVWVAASELSQWIWRTDTATPRPPSTGASE